MLCVVEDIETCVHRTQRDPFISAYTRHDGSVGDIAALDDRQIVDIRVFAQLIGDLAAVGRCRERSRVIPIGQIVEIFTASGVSGRAVSRVIDRLHDFTIIDHKLIDGNETMIIICGKQDSDIICFNCFIQFAFKVIITRVHGIMRPAVCCLAVMVVIFYAIADLSNVDPFFAIGRNLDLAITQIVQLTIGVVHADLRDASRLTQLICDVTAFLRIILETRYRVKLTIKRIEQRACAAGIICAIRRIDAHRRLDKFVFLDLYRVDRKGVQIEGHCAVRVVDQSDITHIAIICTSSPFDLVLSELQRQSVSRHIDIDAFDLLDALQLDTYVFARLQRDALCCFQRSRRQGMVIADRRARITVSVRIICGLIVRVGHAHFREADPFRDMLVIDQTHIARFHTAEIFFDDILSA